MQVKGIFFFKQPSSNLGSLGGLIYRYVRKLAVMDGGPHHTPILPVHGMDIHLSILKKKKLKAKCLLLNSKYRSEESSL